MFGQPLTGIRVLDLSRLLPGPYCTALLANLGAEVIKIETPLAGDYLRLAPPTLGFGSLFDSLNADKLSVALNYRNPRGRDVFLKLARDVDIIVETLRPGAMTRWGIGYEAVCAVNPRIIYCSLSGYGQNGPYSDRAGHDLNYIAVAGLLALGQIEGESPNLPTTQVADLAGGMLAALSITAAVIKRQRTGESVYLDVALLDAALSWATVLAGDATVQPSGRGPLSGALACYNVYRTADQQWITLAALEPNLWSAFCTAIQRDDLIARQFDPSVKNELTSIFMMRRRTDWMEIFQTTDTCVEAVYTFEEARHQPQVQIRIEGLGLSTTKHAPELGAHTHSILERAGITEAELEELAKRRIIRLAEFP